MMERVVNIKSDFLAAAYGQPHERVPVWIMRQAGRYLPQFQEVRRRHSFLEICWEPRLMAEITRQPIDVFGFDAAILFSDILIPLQPLGIDLTYPVGGPQLDPPIRETVQVSKLKRYDIKLRLAPVLDGISLIRRSLDPSVPLIGFCGSPFTLFSYLVEGSGSKGYIETKKFLYGNPEAAQELLDLLTDIVGEYLRLQIEAGVETVQIFDSLGGILSVADYQRYSLPSIERSFDSCAVTGVPRILYLKNTTPFLPLLADLNCEVIGVDWQTDLSAAGRILPDKCLQGNFDPGVLFASRELVVSETRRILKQMSERDGFIFNLGHGILPQTPVDNVRALVDTVHEFRR